MCFTTFFTQKQIMSRSGPVEGQAAIALTLTAIDVQFSEPVRTVSVERRFTHPVLKKTVRRSKKYHAHDENNDAHIGDMVRVVESRPISRTKRWRLVEVLERAR